VLVVTIGTVVVLGGIELVVGEGGGVAVVVEVELVPVSPALHAATVSVRAATQTKSARDVHDSLILGS
jgi:hypothetical protein